MTYEIGQVVPHNPRSIIGAKLDHPIWLALRVQAGSEGLRVNQLEREGVFAFYPKEERERFFRGRRIVTERPTITQLIYAQFKHAPNWFEIKERKIATGVIAYQGRPVVIGRPVIRALQGLPARVEEIAAEKARLNVGDEAILGEAAGPLGEMAVEITEVTDTRIWWAVPGTALRGSCAPDHLSKLDVAS